MKMNHESSAVAFEPWVAHRRLAEFNHHRLDPALPTADWRARLEVEHHHRQIEGDVLEWERANVAARAATAPTTTDAFMAWFEDLKATGPGQNSALFAWLAEEADRRQMKWFIQQEVAGEAGFDDLTAMTQVKVSTTAKLEMARNYWDEMGRGREPGMHGPMLARVAEEFELGSTALDQAVPESLALANVLLGLAVNRRYCYHSIGALGAVELTAPGRAILVHQGLKRLGLSAEGQRYYLLHSSLDIKHSADWNREVLRPLIDRDPRVAPAIAEGALMRLNAGARCFERYAREFGLQIH